MSLLEQDHQEGAGVRDVRDVRDVQEQDAVRVRVRPPLSRLPIVRPSQARPFQALLWEHHLLRLHTMAQLIQAMTASTPRASKPRLLVVRTDEYNHNLSKRLLVINNTSAKMTAVVIF